MSGHRTLWLALLLILGAGLAATLLLGGGGEPEPGAPLPSASVAEDGEVRDAESAGSARPLAERTEVEEDGVADGVLPPVETTRLEVSGRVVDSLGNPIPG